MFQSISERDTFTCSNDGTTSKIDHKSNCNKTWLIYLITCKKCFKQYVGQTVDTFRSRWNNYKDNARKYGRSQHCMKNHLCEHFDLPDQTNFLEDVIVTLIANADPRDPTEGGYSWIYTL